MSLDFSDLDRLMQSTNQFWDGARLFGLPWHRAGSNATRMRAIRVGTAPRGFSFLELQVAFVLLGIALAGMGPLVVMQLKQLERLESRLDSDTTYYLTPTTATGAQLPTSYLWARKLGCAASIRDTDSNDAPPQPVAIHVNFQNPAGADPGTFSGVPYLADRGHIYGNRGNGYTYGWNAGNTANMVNRNNPSSPDERYDTFAYMQRNGTFQWNIAVPNGTYTVHIVAGDPASFLLNVYRVRAEGVSIVHGTPSLFNRWIEGTGVVVVTDGNLTVSNGPNSSNNRINYIDITVAPPRKAVGIVSIEKSPISEEVTAHVMVQ